MNEARKIPAPQPNVENQRFFDAAAAGKLLIGQCDACGQPHYYPRALCPFCLAETRWVESKGKGEIYSLSTMRRGGAPFTLAYVTLDEGPAVLTNIATDDHDALRIGQRVTVTFVPSDGGPPVPMFAPE